MIETKAELDEECTRITREGLERMLSAPDILLTMLGPKGFDRPELAGIVDGVVTAINLAIHQIQRVGLPAAQGAA